MCRVIPGLKIGRGEGEGQSVRPWVVGLQVSFASCGHLQAFAKRLAQRACYFPALSQLPANATAAAAE